MSRGKGLVALLSVVLCAPLFAAVETSAGAQAAPDGTISGVITDEAGRALEGIVVSIDREHPNSLEWGAVRSTVTNADGRYSLMAPDSPWNERLSFTDPKGEYAHEVFDEAVTHGEAPPFYGGLPARTINESLALGATISGTVLAAPGSSTPSTTVDVMAPLPDGTGFERVRRTSTDQFGHYELRGIAAASYRLFFYRAGHDRDDPVSPQYWDRQATLDRATPLVVRPPLGDVGRTVTANAAMARPTTLSGTVRGADGVGVLTYVTLFGQIGGRWVVVDSTTSSVDGRYEFDGVDSGAYRLRYTDSEGPHAEQYNGGALTRDSASDVVVEVGRDRDGVDARLVRASTVSGTVTTEGGGPYSAGVVLDRLVDGEWQERVTSTSVNSSSTPTGRYLIGDLPAGSYRVRFEASGGMVPEYWDNVGPGGEPTTLRVGMEEDVSGIDASLELGGHVVLPVTNDLYGARSDVYATIFRRVGAQWSWAAQVPAFDPETDFTNLVPGTYIISLYDYANVFAQQWYRGATSEQDATQLEVRAGETTVLEPMTLRPRSVTHARRPVITGRAGTDTTLGVWTGTWIPSDAALSVQWLRDGVPIAYATGTRYRPVLADVGHRLTARVTAARDGFTGAVALTEAQSVSRIVIERTSAPIIRGRLVAGRTVRVSGDAYRPAASQRRYQWYVDGRPLRGRTAPRLTLTRALIGHRVGVRVAATTSGTTVARSAVLAPGRVQRR